MTNLSRKYYYLSQQIGIELWCVLAQPHFSLVYRKRHLLPVPSIRFYQVSQTTKMSGNWWTVLARYQLINIQVSLIIQRLTSMKKFENSWCKKNTFALLSVSCLPEWREWNTFFKACVNESCELCSGRTGWAESQKEEEEEEPGAWVVTAIALVPAAVGNFRVIQARGPAVT